MKPLTPELKIKYNELFKTAVLTKDPSYSVNKIIQYKNTYIKVQDKTGVPWYIIGCIHSLEASFNFKSHLANGDPLTARTTHVPKGIPKEGNPPFSWEDAAIAALNLKLPYPNFNSIAGMCYFLEQYNGLGYLNRGLNSPYLWSYTNHYTKGKYVEDGKFNPEAVSKQIGAVAIILKMVPILFGNDKINL